MEMDREDAGLLMLMALKKTVGQANALFGQGSLDVEAVALQLRVDLDDERLRAVCFIFNGRCKNGCDDPVACCNVTASAITRWLRYQKFYLKRAEREAWASSTN